VRFVGYHWTAAFAGAEALLVVAGVAATAGMGAGAFAGVAMICLRQSQTVPSTNNLQTLLSDDTTLQTNTTGLDSLLLGTMSSNG
jgi:hypothetical protein